MGPATVFDKSFLQSLSVDESVWFDQYFSTVITPLFFVETLADLTKAPREGWTAEKEVAVIAGRTPLAHSMPNIHHQKLCEAELHGWKAPMNFKPAIGGGKPVNRDGQTGYVFDVSQEAAAFERWRDGQFAEVERLFAGAWRADLAEPTVPRGRKFLDGYGAAVSGCRNLQQVRDLAHVIVSDCGPSPFHRLTFLFEMLGISRDRNYIAARFGKAGAPAWPVYAPYTAHLLEVAIFFQFACDRGFIARERASNRVDIAYLNYLPFCGVFVSNDKLHAKSVPLFLQSEQDFVWGKDLKADLLQINLLHGEVPEAEKEKGILHFAPHPPATGEYLTSKLWDKHRPKWRDPKPSLGSIPPEAMAKLIDRMKKAKASVNSGVPVPGFKDEDINILQN